MLTCPSEGVDALAEYHRSIGGRPEGGKKRKSRKSGVETETSTPVAAKRMKKEKEWAPPPGSWETDVDHVDTVEQRPNPKTGEQEKFGYLVWNNRIKTQHPLPLIFKKCPQRVGVVRFLCRVDKADKL
jgi:chromobox protein 1